jgi:hypothetical protein
VEHHASLKTISFESKISQSKFFTNLYGDERRYLQILVNFLSNSLKFSPRNSSITVALDVKDQFLKPDNNNPRNTPRSPRSPKSIRGRASQFNGFMEKK